MYIVTCYRFYIDASMIVPQLAAATKFFEVFG